ncbi:DUF4142 domain-containing protein [Pontibacter sp. SGAir0037]|uniref:DUF4142 domain-containing protein n=1 Tax=Pontibacter sp. SGAir0037 TaxID=2571030 RepID=UPI0010CD1F5C|nr:DUF4142 domain-containing protein [Pontibacter sp. SGAir0037]QCR24617.1 DUF4142 domain-containing protein [Pontibacter sp. SGAir0037]
MKNYMMAVYLMAGALAFASCNSGNNNEEQATSANASGEPAVALEADSTLTDEKKELLSYLNEKILLQQELGRIAVERGQSDAVKQYGQQMVTQYEPKQASLQDLAQDFNVSLTQSDDNQSKVQDLRDVKAENFDKKYLDEVASAHKDAISEIDNVLNDPGETNNSLVNVWARTTKKEMQAQREEALRLQQEMKR